MQAPELTPADNELLDLLREHQILDARQLQQVLSARTQAWQRAMERLEGTFCTVVNGQLQISDYLSGEEKARFSLETGFPDASQPTVVWVDENTGHEIGRAEPETDGLGLLITPSGNLLMSQDPTALPFLGHGDAMPLMPGHDFFASPDGRYLLVSERQAGRLQIFSLEQLTRVANFEIRPLGSHKAIHACFIGDAIWITDSLSSSLGWIQIPPPGGEWELTRGESGLGELGQIAPGADGQSLMIFVLAPRTRIVCLELPTLEQRHNLVLTGDPLSRLGKVPTDCLVQLGHEKLQAIYQIKQGQHRWLTQQALSQRLSLIGDLRVLNEIGGWPWILAGEDNPISRYARRELADWIVELGFLSAEYLVYLRMEARSGGLTEEATPFMVPLGDEAPFDLLLRQAPEIEFAAGAYEVILQLLVQGVQQQGVREMPPELSLRLEQEAEAVCEFLKQHYVSLIEVPIDEANLIFLDLVIERFQLIRLLDARLKGKQLPWRPGHRCPMCQMLLPNPRLCKHCDFALENANWQARRRLQSAESCDELIPGQMLLALPQARRVAFLDAWLQVIAEYDSYCLPLPPEPEEEKPAFDPLDALLADIPSDDDFDDLPQKKAQTAEKAEAPRTPWKEPAHALALPDGHWLICDKGTGQLAEINAQGELMHMFTHPFGQPVQACFRRQDDQLSDLLVLDQGAGCVLSFTREGRFLDSWGADKGLKLKAPRDMQWTWADTLLITDTVRVVEWSPTQGEIRSWGSAQGLQKPALARRQPDGSTLIVDAGRGEILTFAEAAAGEAGVLQSSFAYWPPPAQDPAWIGQGAPDRLLVLPNGDLIGMGRRYWMLIQLSAGKIRWVQPWTGARRPPNQKQRLLEIANEDPTLAPLRRIKILQTLDSLALQQLQQLVEPISVPAGECVLKPEDASGTLFFILEGEVEIRRKGEDEALASITAGDTFGEVNLTLGENYPGGFYAKTDLSLLQLKRGRYKQLVMHTGELGPLLRELAFTRKALLHQYQNTQLQGRVDKVKAQLMAKKLEEISLFTDFDQELLVDLAGQLRQMAYMPGQQVFGQGESGDTLFLIARGKIGIYLEGSSEPLNTLENGDIFGEMAVLTHDPRTATIRSEGYCQLYEIGRDALESLYEREPRLQERLMELAASRRTALDEAVEDQERQAEAQVLKAEVTSLTRVRPARVYALSRLHEQAFSLDETGEICWSGGPLAKVHRPTRLNVDKDLIWIADTGNDRILALSRSEGHPQKPIPLTLDQPRSVMPTPDGRLLIAQNEKLIIASQQGEIVWEFGPPHEIMSPWYAEATLKGTVLFCDRELQMVFEIDLLEENVVWSHGEMLAAGDGPTALNEPSCARRLANGGTVIADTGNDRLLLFSPVGTLMRSFNGSEEIPLTRPVHVEVLDNGELLVYPESQDRVIRLGLGGQPIWQAILPK